MNLNKFIQIWRQLMTLNKRESKKSRPSCETQIELVPTFEEASQFQSRKEEVQVLLTDMFLRLYKRGRPKNEEKEESHAA